MLGIVGALEGKKVFAYGIDVIVGLHLRDSFSLLSRVIKFPDLRISGGAANQPPNADVRSVNLLIVLKAVDGRSRRGSVDL